MTCPVWMVIEENRDINEDVKHWKQSSMIGLHKQFSKPTNLTFLVPSYKRIYVRLCCHSKARRWQSCLRKSLQPLALLRVMSSNVCLIFLISDTFICTYVPWAFQKAWKSPHQCMVMWGKTLNPSYVNICSTLGYLCSTFILSSISKTVKSHCCQTQLESNPHEDRWDDIWS